MLILSTTYLIEDSEAESWKLWMKSTFLCLLQDSSADAQRIVFCKVHTDAQQDGQTFSLQVQFDNLDLLDQFARSTYPACEQAMNRRFAGKFLVFQTVLEEV